MEETLDQENQKYCFQGKMSRRNQKEVGKANLQNSFPRKNKNRYQSFSLPLKGNAHYVENGEKIFLVKPRIPTVIQITSLLAKRRNCNDERYRIF